MALANTTIITDDNDQIQHQELLDWIWSQEILMVILGNTADSNKGKTTASNYSNDSVGDYSRHVLQITNPSALTAQSVEALSKVGLIKDREDLKDIKAFCLGINPRISYRRVHKNASLRNPFVIKDLYTEAEQNSKKTPANL